MSLTAHTTLHSALLGSILGSHNTKTFCHFLFVCVLALSLLVCFQLFLVEMMDSRGLSSILFLQV